MKKTKQKSNPFSLSDGFYIYQECDNVANGRNARLLSPTFFLTAMEQICVQFRYYMYGSDTSNVLRLLVKRQNSEDELWVKTGLQSTAWLKGAVTVSNSTNQGLSVSVHFQAKRTQYIVASNACRGFEIRRKYW